MYIFQIIDFVKPSSRWSGSLALWYTLVHEKSYFYFFLQFLCHQQCLDVVIHLFSKDECNNQHYSIEYIKKVMKSACVLMYGCQNLEKSCAHNIPSVHAVYYRTIPITNETLENFFQKWPFSLSSVHPVHFEKQKFLERWILS